MVRKKRETQKSARASIFQNQKQHKKNAVWIKTEMFIWLYGKRLLVFYQLNGMGHWTRASIAKSNAYFVIAHLFV